jgi:hypothetical protein
MNTTEIFPYDTPDNTFNRDRVLRPELVCMYERQLKADTMKLHPSDQEKEEKDLRQT